MAEESPLPRWRILESEEEQRCRVFWVERRRMREDPVPGEAARGEGDFFVIHSSDWVNVVALTPGEDLVLIEQWRHGVLRPTLEIPGGMVDDGETPLDAARRELQEETGFVAPEWTDIGRVDPNPAIQSNQCYTFLALGAERQTVPTFDSHERCRLRLAPWREAGELVRSGAITHALVVAALLHARLHRRE